MERVLASGRIAIIGERGKVELATCGWLVEVPSGNPEPDSEADCWREVDCGAPLFAIDGDIDAGWYCANGHQHYTYGSARQQQQEREEAFIETLASQGMVTEDEAERHVANLHRRIA